MDTGSPPPLKKICISKEMLASDGSKHVVRAYSLPQQYAGRNQTGNGMHIMKFKSVDGKEIGEFKVKMISKAESVGSKTVMLIKEPKQNGSQPPDNSDAEESVLKLQSQYTTKTVGLPEVKKDPNEKSKQPAMRRPLILKKNVKPINKVAQVEQPQPQSNKVQLIKLAKPIVTDVKSLALPEKVNLMPLPEQGKVIKSYTRTLKKIGPNMQLLPHDSPDAKQIINAVTEPVSTRNGTIRYIQKSVISQNGKPVINQPEPVKEAPKDISQNLTIIEQALSSLSDGYLREKALKALAECTTGNTRNTTVNNPDAIPKLGMTSFGIGVTKGLNEIKSISDSSCQTEVFSMMVPGEFILASTETEKLERRKAKEREQEEAEKSTVPDKTVFQKELDNILKDFGSENPPVEKVLEKNKVNFPEKIARNLYNDYTSMKNYNTDGMLGIHQVVVANDIKGVKRLLMMIRLLSPLGIDVDVRTLDGNTSLELAVECQVDEQIIEELLKAGAKPSTNDPMQNSALALASKKGLSYFPLLVEHTDKERLDDYDLDGYTCLHYCAQNGDIEGTRSLLVQGAEVNLPDRKSGKTPLFMAMENQQEEVAKILCTWGADPSIPNNAGQTILPFIELLKSYALKAALHKSLR